METAKPDWKDNLRFFITNKLYINLMNADYIIHEVDMLMIPIKAEVMEQKERIKELEARLAVARSLPDHCIEGFSDDKYCEHLGKCEMCLTKIQF